MSDPPNARIRRATSDDAKVCGRICYEAFATINRQHNFPPELPSVEVAAGRLGMIFSHPGFFCVVAESDGRIVGSNCMDERSKIAGIGPVTVDPSVQNQSIGRMLMHAVMERARERGFPGIRLVQATFHTRSLSLYAKLGFEVRDLFLVMHGPAIKSSIEGCVVRIATEDDLDSANRICEKVHGHDRSGDLEEAIRNGMALVVEQNHQIKGYASGFGYPSHAVAESNLELKALIAAATDIPRPGILVPARNADLLRWCLANGLRAVQPMTLMTIGLYNEPEGAWLPSVLY